MVFAELMEQLGYDRYGTHGGDFGSLVSPALGRLHPDRVIGAHVNGIATAPTKNQLADLTEAERERLEDFQHFWRDERGYAVIQATRPHTRADSPVG